MWKCPDCGVLNNYNFCVSCGRRCPREFEGQEQESKISEYRPTNKSSTGLIITCVTSICVGLLAIIISLVVLFLNNTEKAAVTNSEPTVTDDVKPIRTPSPTPTPTPSPEPTRLYDNRKAFIEHAKRQLGVPQDADVECQIGKPYMWEAGGIELVHVSFTKNGELVAGADCDIITGDITRGIYEYTPTEDETEEIQYTCYKNDRYGFSLDVPNFLKNKMSSDNGDGASFSDEQGETELIAYGSHAIGFLDSVTIDALYSYVKNNIEYEISYDRKKDNWFVLSGERAGKVFYEKHVLKSDGTHNCFRIVYSKNRGKDFDAIVTHIYNSFKTGVGYDSYATE